MTDKLEILLVSAQEDSNLLHKLENHLKPLEIQGLIAVWDVSKIPPGVEPEIEINKHLNAASIILLLVSANLMASEKDYNIVVKAMEKYRNNQARVIPILLHEYDWKDTPFGMLTPLPTNAKPIGSWENRDAAYVDVVQGIRTIITDLQTPTVSNNTNLYNALLKLDFRNQVLLFRKLIHRSPIGAFIIHGEPDYGQRWLLNRLINQVPYSTAGKIVRLDLMSIARRWGLDALHREFKRQQGLAGTLSLQGVVEQVHGWWQTQPVILIFHNLSALDEAHMQELIQHFWVPLVDKAMSAPSSSPDYKLLVFMIDNDGYIEVWPFTVAEQLDDTWKPYIPLKPPKLTPILNDELMTWVAYEGDNLPPKLQVEDILKDNNDGVPERVLEHICDLCNCNWFEREHLWIKY